MVTVHTMTVLVGVGLVATGLVPVGSAATAEPGSQVAAAPKTCEAWNQTTGGAVMADLQAVIDAAAPGDEVWVAGRCVGGFSVTKDLVIRSGPADSRAFPRPRATLTGEHATRVLAVRGAKDGLITVTLRGLRLTAGLADIKAGKGDQGGAVLSTRANLRLVDCAVTDSKAVKFSGSLSAGGGIFEGGGRMSWLTLVDTVVRGNWAWLGGGVSASHVRLTGTSRVTGNVAGAVGGGLQARRVVMAGEAEVDHNAAGSGGGVAASSRPFKVAVRMVDSAAVHHNVARTQDGGGISSERGGVVLADRARVTRNAAMGRQGDGGGIRSSGRSQLVQLKGDSSVRNNIARSGGGIYQYAGTFQMTDRASVSGNVAQRRGGGIFIAKGEVLVRGRATVTSNLAKRTGGGVYAESGRIRPADVRVREDAHVYRNIPNDIVIR
ncbi:MAG: hypothetical protein OEV62_06590 [Actinomycetota bacterium]|nr:hypothetical protein [Actinomycetota bacterium]